jgi:phenylalanyl-tRNA synthetase beta chain
MRFERGVDPEAVPTGADRACRLMSEWCGASVLRGVLEVGGAPPRRRISLRPSRASALIGYAVSAGDAEEVFDRLGMPVEREGEDAVGVEVPGYRVDLEREVDLIEEVVRVQGYERVGSTLPPVRQAGGLPAPYAFLERVRRTMVRAGTREVRLAPFVSERDLALVGGGDAVRITNPLQADEAWLRTSLLPGLLRTAQRNASRHVRNVAIFEASVVFEMADDRPQERRSVAFALVGTADVGWTGSGRGYDVLDAKGVVETLLADLGVAWSTGEPLRDPMHPGRSASIVAEGRTIGVFGELHPKVAAGFDLPGRVAVGELDVDVLMAIAPDGLEVREPPRFPPVRRDLAFTVEAATPAGAVQAAIVRTAGSLLDACLLFDVHTGPPLPEGAKSLAFSIDFRAADRTLTDPEVNEAVAAIAERLERDLGARLRSA